MISILGLTTGLLCNKLRDKSAAKLRDGDVTHEKIRERIIRTMDDIKNKLGGLLRKDLLTSYGYLQEGVSLLNESQCIAMHKSNSEKKTVPNDSPDGLGETVPSVVELQCILNEALQLNPHATGSLPESESAKERFKDARKKAMEAFYNEALTIKDRIFAAKLRIVSEILECLDNPDTAKAGCLTFLKELHGLSAIREMFSAYINNGKFKTMFHKEERVENVKSVMLINNVLFQFVSKFTSKYSAALDWPTIQHADRIFNPILNWQDISTRKSMGEELIQPPNGLSLDEREEINPSGSVVNSHGEIVVGYGNDIRVISQTGESKVVKLPNLREHEAIEQHIVGLAVDINDNVYLVIIKWLKTRSENDDDQKVDDHLLYVYDNNYNVKNERRLDFLEKTFLHYLRVAITKNNDILMIRYGDPHVYVCDNSGQLKHKFKQDSRQLRSLGISDKNEIIIPSDNEKAVHIYTEEGDRKFTINLPDDHQVLGVASHYVISKITVLTCIKKNGSHFLLCYSDDAGKLENSIHPFKTIGIVAEEHFDPVITSHPGGPAAVVRQRSITYI